jgi:rhamnulokinase
MPASHDTASAVMAVPNAGEETLYISSGTWSLMGIELREPNFSMDSMKANFTNEGGYDYRYRYLKNIMGLWMIQSVKKEMGEGYSYAEICEMASKEEITSLVDCNDNCFLSPDSMVEAVKNFCDRSNQQLPETLGEIAAVIYNSLAKCYASTITQIEQLTGKHFDCIHIIGGGSNADYLNKLTAGYTGRKVLAGPTEATAIGNILAQMLKSGELSTLMEARECVAGSFDIREY